MSFKDSDFREIPKYFGDVVATIPNNHVGIASSSNYFAFGYEKSNIGYLPADFFTNITEKAAQGRKAEYGSKIYAANQINKCVVNNEEYALTSLLFSPFDDNILITGHETGIVNLWNLPQHYKDMKDIEKPSLTIKDLTAQVSCVTYHPLANHVLAIGGNGSIFLSDLNKDGTIVHKINNLETVIGSLQFTSNGSLLRGVARNGKLISYDPRTNSNDILFGDFKCIPEGFHHLSKISSADNIILVTGQTGFRESIVQTFDIRNNNLSQPLFKENYKHKNCFSLSHYDVYTNFFYVSFRSTADVVVYNVLQDGSLDKQSVYHSGNDTFYGMSVMPKHNVKKREINKIIKLGKNRAQLLVHHRGGKLIYDHISAEIIKPTLSSTDYFGSKKNGENINHDSFCKLTPGDFEEKAERKTSLYLHIAGKEPLNIQDRFYNIITSNTVNMALGNNIKCNTRYCIFPSKATGGGALGIVDYNIIGRQHQKEIRAHSEQMSTFDVSLLNEQLVATGAHDSKVYVWKLPEKLFDKDSNNSKSSSTKQANEDVGIEKLHTFQHEGKVTFVGFHKRIPNLLITADRGLEGSNIKIWDIAKGEKIWQWENFATNGALIMDIEFEPLYGLIAAVSSQDKIVRIIDIKNKKILLQWEPSESMRDIKLTWIRDSSNTNNFKKHFTRLMTLGFRKGSIRALSIWDLEDVVTKYYTQTLQTDEKTNDENESKRNGKENDDMSDLSPLIEQTFGVSNAIPIIYYDPDNNLIYMSSVGDRKIKVYEINHTLNALNEMNQSFNSKDDIFGTAYKPKQNVDVSIVEQAVCFKLTKSEISPISFTIPRKRKEYFQDDLYVETVDFTTPIIDDVGIFIEWLNNKTTVNKFNISYINLQPKNMIKLSEAPEEDLSELQKKRNSLLEKMEKEKMSTNPKSTEQAFNAFSKIVDNAPSANRWDAVNIGTEVAEDEWNDSD